MGDVPFEPEHEPTREERVKTVAREVIAGHPEAGVRRIILYIIAILALQLCAFGFFVAVIPGLVALVILATSDQLA